MKKKFSIVLSLILLSSFVFVGCWTDPPETSYSDSTNTTLSEQNEATNQKVIESPEEGWTIESLVNAMTFFRKRNFLSDDIGTVW